MKIRVYNCERCNVEFEPKRLEQRFHSAECYTLSLREKDWSRECLRPECKNIIEDRESVKKYCSHRCSAIVSNSNRKKPSRKCLNCQDYLALYGRGIREDSKVYCDRKCKKEHQTSLWLSNELDGSNKHTFKSFVKEYIYERDNSSCVECGYNTLRKDGASILQIDHIDGNWKNNTPNNLRLLCPNCHAHTDTYGARNKGNGRTWKKDYNQFEGKHSEVV